MSPLKSLTKPFDIQKSIFFIYINNNQLEDKMQEKTFYASNIKGKISNKNLMGAMQHLYRENFENTD